MEKLANDPANNSILNVNAGTNNFTNTNTNINNNYKFSQFTSLLNSMNREEKQIIGIFKVTKLAKKAFTTNHRILVVTEALFSYYNIPPKKGTTENFIKLLEKIYNPKRIHSSSNKSEDEEKDFTQLSKEFLENNSSFLKKEEFPYEKTEILYDVDQKENKKKWKYCVMIRQINNSNYNDDKTNVDKKKVQWIMNFLESNYVERLKKIYEEIKKKKAGNLIKEIIHAKQPEQTPKIIPKIIKKEEEPPKKEEKVKANTENVPEVDPEITQMMYYKEICYQYLLKQYFNVCNHKDINTRNKMRMKYEFAILQLTTKFKEICQTISKKIVADLYAQAFQKPNTQSYSSLHPIIFPYPTKLKKSDQAVFLYYIRGINFTLTWHQTMFRMRSEPKFELEDHILNGAWNNLNVEFKNRDFFTDLMIGLCRDFPEKLDLPRYPISCMVDYCGFRILCESDIYVDDGFQIMRRIEAMSSQINPDENYFFFKEIASLVSKEKVIYSSKQNTNCNLKQSPGVKVDKDQIQPIADILISVTYQGKEERQHSKAFGFQHVIKYHSKQFKEVEPIFADGDIANILIPKNDKFDNNDFSLNYDIANQNLTVDKVNKIPENYDVFAPIVEENSINHKIKNKSKHTFNDFFDLSLTHSQTNIYLKDMKEPTKYIMDLKVLIELNDKPNFNTATIHKKQKTINNVVNQSDSSIPKRSVYFRPEFIVKYLKENEPELSKPIDRGIDMKESFLINLKKYLYLADDGTPQYKKIEETNRYFKDFHINFFINSLDTMHFKPYDSETLTETFHRYGVNMFYLGLVAEITSVPHIRELCQIEMISRVCKRMLFDMMAHKIIKRANEDYYLGSNDHVKSAIEYDYSGNSSEPHLQFVPVSFFVRYWKDYLKKLHILGSDSNKCHYYDETNKSSTLNVKGLYRRNWHKCSSYQDKEIKNIFQSKDEKTGGKNNKESIEISMLTEAKKEIIQFLNVLFDFENKNTFKFINYEFNNKSLWANIFDKIKSHYSIENYKDVFAYCDPMYISLPALFSSIQFHTGINVNFTVQNSKKYNNKDLINFTFTEESIEIKARTKVYSYRYFLLNRDKFDTIRNDYSLFYDHSLYRKVLLRYITEKIQKNVTTYTFTYLLYMNVIRRMDNNNQIDSVVAWINKNDLDLKEKIKTETDYAEYYRNQFSLIPYKFESYNYLFLIIIESITNLFANDDKNLNINNTSNIQSSKNSGITINIFDIENATDYISEFWFSKHPFLCVLNVLIARLYIKAFTQMHHYEKSDLKVIFETYFKNLIEVHFKKAFEIAKDSLGTNNIYIANLCEEIGYCYIKSENYYEGITYYIIAHNVFKDNKVEFYECYMKILKKITKYYTILGYYKNALEFGTELVNAYIYSEEKNRLDKYYIAAVIFNLILISKSLGEYEKGTDFCKKLLYDLDPGVKPDINFEITHFRDWRICMQGKKNHKKISKSIEKIENNNGEKYEIKKMLQIIKIYMEIIVKNLKDSDRKIYVQALVKLTENKQEREILKSIVSDQQQLFESFFPLIKDEAELGKFFYKMLYHIGAKFDQDKSYQKANDITSTEIDKNYNENWIKFRNLYKIFEKNKVFTNYMDKDYYNASNK